MKRFVSCCVRALSFVGLNGRKGESELCVFHARHKHILLTAVTHCFQGQTCRVHCTEYEPIPSSTATASVNRSCHIHRPEWWHLERRLTCTTRVTLPVVRKCRSEACRLLGVITVYSKWRVWGLSVVLPVRNSTLIGLNPIYDNWHIAHCVRGATDSRSRSTGSDVLHGRGLPNWCRTGCGVVFPWNACLKRSSRRSTRVIVFVVDSSATYAALYRLHRLPTASTHRLHRSRHSSTKVPPNFHAPSHTVSTVIKVKV